MDATKDKVMVTYHMALVILEREVEHAEDLQCLCEDLNLMMSRRGTTEVPDQEGFVLAPSLFTLDDPLIPLPDGEDSGAAAV
jgi:hypothetical protein